MHKEILTDVLLKSNALVKGFITVFHLTFRIVDISNNAMR